MSVELKLEEQSRRNLDKNLEIIRRDYPDKVRQFVVKLGYDIKYLAQQKLKGDKHIVTSRLRNSIFVKTFNKKDQNRKGNESQYTYGKVVGRSKSGKPIVRENTLTGTRDLQGVNIQGPDDIAVGTNVEYASNIEFNHDPFLNWAAQSVDVRKRATQLKKELKEIKHVKG